MRLLIVGGSDAGISAGLRARELAPEIRPTLVVADDYPNFSICGIPFWLSGETPDWRDLAHRDRATLDDAGLDLRLDTTATTIDVDGHRLAVRPTGRDGPVEWLDYDALVVGTGAVPARPPIDGLDLPGVHLLHSMGQAFALNRDLEEAASAVIVGAGYIGLELADALRRRGLAVTVVELAGEVLTTVDPELGSHVGDELTDNGVTVATATVVDRIVADGDRLAVIADADTTFHGDVVVVAAGVRPNTELLAAAGATVGAGKAIEVDPHMGTGLADVYAAGDCVHTHHRLLDDPTYMPLGTTAHKQGRVAGENAVGGDTHYAGSLGTQVVKVFDTVIARTGLRHDEATTAGHTPATHQVTVDDHKAYYPGATDIHIRITGDRDTGRLLGAQLLGRVGAQVAKRVDVMATAIHHGMAVDDINALDLSYTPPLSAPWDPVQTAAQAWNAAIR